MSFTSSFRPPLQPSPAPGIDPAIQSGTSVGQASPTPAGAWPSTSPAVSHRENGQLTVSATANWAMVSTDADVSNGSLLSASFGSFGRHVQLRSSGTAGESDDGAPSTQPLDMTIRSNLPPFGSSIQDARRADEAEAKRRALTTIISTLKQRPGRISEEAVERIARINELSVLWDPPLQEPPRRDGSRTLTIAGTALLVDVDFVFRTPARVMAVLPESSHDIGLSEQAVSRVLENTIVHDAAVDLLAASLGDGFAANIERLARMERLSSSTFNCHTAVAGLSSSLSRLYQVEKNGVVAASRDQSAGSIRSIAEVVCKRSGRVRNNAHDQVGVSVEYWIPSRAAVVRELESQLFGQPDVKDDDVDFLSVFSLQIECEQLQKGSVGPARSTQEWISDPVWVPTSTSTAPSHDINWLDPPRSTPEPNVQFIARLFPAVPVPASVAREILQPVGPAEASFRLAQRRLETLLFLDEIDMHAFMSAGHDPIQPDMRNRPVVAVGPDTTSTPRREHHTVLSISPSEPAVMLDRIPFNHPRFLIALLPILRQYASIGPIMKPYFCPPVVVSTLSKPADEQPELDAHFPGPESSFISRIYLGQQPDQAPVIPATPKSDFALNAAVAVPARLGSLPVDASMSFSGLKPRLYLSFRDIWTPTRSSSPSVSSTNKLSRSFELRTGEGMDSMSFLSPFASQLPASSQPDTDNLMESLYMLGSGPGGLGQTECSAVVVALDFGLNGLIRVVDHNMTGRIDSQATPVPLSHNHTRELRLEKERVRRELERALEVAADFGTWIEWAGKKYLAAAT